MISSWVYCIFTFYFSEVPKWSPRSIFEAFGRPVGSLRGSFGATFALWGPSWHPFGDHFGFFGTRSHGSLGTTLVVILMVFMSKPSSGHNIDGFDDQITQK